MSDPDFWQTQMVMLIVMIIFILPSLKKEHNFFLADQNKVLNKVHEYFSIFDYNYIVVKPPNCPLNDHIFEIIVVHEDCSQKK